MLLLFWTRLFHRGRKSHPRRVLTSRRKLPLGRTGFRLRVPQMHRSACHHRPLLLFTLILLPLLPPLPKTPASLLRSPLVPALPLCFTTTSAAQPRKMLHLIASPPIFRRSSRLPHRQGCPRKHIGTRRASWQTIVTKLFTALMPTISSPCMQPAKHSRKKNS